jgi:hypothetical protein
MYASTCTSIHTYNELTYAFVYKYMCRKPNSGGWKRRKTQQGVQVSGLTKNEGLDHDDDDDDG